MRSVMRLILLNAAGMAYLAPEGRHGRELTAGEREVTLQSLLGVHPKPLICPECGRPADHPPGGWVAYGVPCCSTCREEEHQLRAARPPHVPYWAPLT